MKHHFLKAMMMMAALCFPMAMSSCGSDDNDNNKGPIIDPVEPAKPVRSDFAKGADVSWLTEMEKAGQKFYNSAGEQKECMQLLQELGFNAIRLRVWVNPTDGWNAKDDVLTKAKRAKELGLPVMVDFHYSDTWADPGKQTIPTAWSSYTLSEMKQAVASHTNEVLQALKNNGVDVPWVQVGNETNNGMLWPIGQADKSMSNYAALTTAGYDAVKEVYPDAQVIVHVSNGHQWDTFKWIFDGLKQYGGKWDVIGMSLYADEDAQNNWFSTQWSTMAKQCLTNINRLIVAYNTPVMVCEIGCRWDDPNAAAFLSTMVEGTKEIDRCLGIFYWEPQCVAGWNGYNKGAFSKEGKPMPSLNAFK